MYVYSILNTLKLISSWSLFGICLISASHGILALLTWKKTPQNIIACSKICEKTTKNIEISPHLPSSPPLCLLPKPLCRLSSTTHPDLAERVSVYFSWFQKHRKAMEVHTSSDLSPRASPCCLHAGWTVLRCGPLFSGWEKSELSGAGRKVEKEALGLGWQDLLTRVVWVLRDVWLLRWKELFWNVGKLRIGVFCMELATSSLARNNLPLGPEGFVLVK